MKRDPLEENNIEKDNPDIIKKMEGVLLDLQNGKGFSYDKGEDLADEERKIIKKELKKLGYI